MCEEKVSKDVEERGLTRAPRPNRWRKTGRRADQTKKAHDPGLGVLDPRSQGAKAKASIAGMGQGIFSRCSGTGSGFLKMRFHLRSTLQALTKTRFYAFLAHHRRCCQGKAVAGTGCSSNARRPRGLCQKCAYRLT